MVDAIGARPRAQRLKARREFLYVARGRSQARPGLVVQMRANRTRTDAYGVGFTATKKVGNAVVRNRCKRRLRAAARELLPRLGQAQTDYVFVARLQTPARTWVGLLDDMESALITLSRPRPALKPADRASRSTL
ncbi:MAG: ribonuclease P protein component [Maricaulaceae bacterium]